MTRIDSPLEIPTPNSNAVSIRTLVVMIVAALLSLIIWIGFGVIMWRGYPGEHPGGRIISLALGLSVQVVLLSIARLAVTSTKASVPILCTAVVCWSIARLVTTSLFPLGGDEAYHWMWAKHLDLCYYDHPAMVAWLARLLAPSNGQAIVWVRLSSVVIGAAMPLMVYLLASRTILSRIEAVWAALLYMLVPVFSGTVFLIPHVPLGFFWLLSLIFLWRALLLGKWFDWLFLGLAYGGAINCNFIAFLLPLCAALYALVSRNDRRLLLSPGPYIAILIAGMCCLPMLLWNQRHDWVTFRFNFTSRHHSLAFHPSSAAAYLLQLLVLLSPVLAIGIVRFGIPQFCLALMKKKRAILFLICLGFGPILAFFLTSCLLKPRAHYATPGFVPLLILFIYGCSRAMNRQREQWPAKWYKYTIYPALAMSMIFFAALLVPAMASPGLAFKVLNHLSPKVAEKRTAELYGLPALGRYLDAQPERMNATSNTIVFAPSYAQASLAAYYARTVDFVYSLDEGRSPYGQQFSMWATLNNLPRGRNAILFHAGPLSNPTEYLREWRRRFQRVEIDRIAEVQVDPLLKSFVIIRSYGYSGHGLPIR